MNLFTVSVEQLQLKALVKDITTGNPSILKPLASSINLKINL